LLFFYSAVTETINDVITACLVSKSPAIIERIECDNAIRDMETSKNLLQQSVLQPCANYTYFETLDNVVEYSKRLGEAMTHIASASKNTNHQLFIQAVQDASKAVCRLAESSAQVNKKELYIFVLKEKIVLLGKLSDRCVGSHLNERNESDC
jgi:talin